MPCVSSTYLINQYGNDCAPGDRACWESKGVSIKAGPFGSAPGGGPPDLCGCDCTNDGDCGGGEICCEGNCIVPVDLSRYDVYINNVKVVSNFADLPAPECGSNGQISYEFAWRNTCGGFWITATSYADLGICQRSWFTGLAANLPKFPIDSNGNITGPAQLGTLQPCVGPGNDPCDQQMCACLTAPTVTAVLK